MNSFCHKIAKCVIDEKKHNSSWESDKLTKKRVKYLEDYLIGKKKGSGFNQKKPGSEQAVQVSNGTYE